MRNKLESIKKQVLNKNITVEEFASVVRNEVDELGVEVTVQYVNDFPVNAMSANGYFNSYDWDIKQNIELELITSDEADFININIDNWDFFEHQMRQTLEHEMIHREQTINRNGVNILPEYLEGMTDEQKRIVYLSNPDEIGAYANDIVLDLLATYTRLGASAILSDPITITEKESPILFEYVELFGAGSVIVKEVVSIAMDKITH